MCKRSRILGVINSMPYLAVRSPAGQALALWFFMTALMSPGPVLSFMVHKTFAPHSDYYFFVFVQAPLMSIIGTLFARMVLERDFRVRPDRDEGAARDILEGIARSGGLRQVSRRYPSAQAFAEDMTALERLRKVKNSKLTDEERKGLAEIRERVLS